METQWKEANTPLRTHKNQTNEKQSLEMQQKNTAIQISPTAKAHGRKKNADGKHPTATKIARFCPDEG